jgi:hypothetical protein
MFITSKEIELLRQELKNGLDAQNNKIRADMIAFGEIIKHLESLINDLSKKLDDRTELKDFQSEVNTLKTKVINLERNIGT